jgi:hypothetical protein
MLASPVLCRAFGRGPRNDRICGSSRGHPEECGALAHAEDAVTARFDVAVRERSRRVGDGEFELGWAEVDDDVRLAAAMARGIGQGFLDDPIGRLV